MPSALDILEVLRRAAANPAADLSMDGLSDLAGWSPAHLHRAFRGVALETPKAWTTRIRLAHALKLLHETDAPVADVAQQAGFASHEVMTRTFRRVLGSTPTALRETGASSHLGHAACLALYHLPLEPRSPTMTIEATIQQRAAQPVLFMRKTVPPEGLQPAMAECLPAVFMHCQSNGVAMAGPPFTRYVDMTRGTFTIEAGMPVAAAEAAEPVLAGELPGGEIAVAIHHGPYDTLGTTHSGLEAWVKAQGRTPSGPPWESYITDPGETPNPADWRTEVCLPLT